MTPLYPYQVEGAKWLAERKVALLADEMGVGKSAQAIHACDLVGAKTVLVVCRAVARSNWRDEFDKFSRGQPEDRLVTITSYEGLEKVLLSSQEMYDVCIIDESHYVKEPRAKRTRTVLGKMGAVHRGKQTFLLTGTPTPNHAGELWTTLYTFGCTRLSYDQFVERYCLTRATSYGRQIVGSNVDPYKVAEIRGLLAPVCLRRTKEDVNLGLPPIRFDTVVIEPGKVDIKMFPTFVRYTMAPYMIKDLVRVIEQELGIVNSIVGTKVTDETIKVLEANAKSIMTLRRYNSLQKIEPVLDMITEELRSQAYEKLVIFGIHRDTLEELRERTEKEFGTVLVYGGTRPEKIKDRIYRFQNSRHCRIFIGNILSAGTSITLTAADQVLFIDQDFVPGNNMQAAARCHRIGQTRIVNVRFAALANSIDQHIAKILSRKTEELMILLEGITQEKPRQEKAKVTLNDLF